MNGRTDVDILASDTHCLNTFKTLCKCLEK